eukprot:3795436-Prymnesium_polylepis.2
MVRFTILPPAATRRAMEHGANSQAPVVVLKHRPSTARRRSHVKAATSNATGTCSCCPSSANCECMARGRCAHTIAPRRPHRASPTRGRCSIRSPRVAEMPPLAPPALRRHQQEPHWQPMQNPQARRQRRQPARTADMVRTPQ